MNDSETLWKQINYQLEMVSNKLQILLENLPIRCKYFDDDDCKCLRDPRQNDPNMQQNDNYVKCEGDILQCSLSKWELTNVKVIYYNEESKMGIRKGA